VGRCQLSDIVIVATMDTKAASARYLAALVASAGGRPLLVDASCLREPDLEVDIGRDEVARAAGLQGAADLVQFDRGERVAAMGRGVAAVVAGLPRLGGALFLGGNQGAAIAAMAAGALPAALPAVLVTTIPPAARSPELARFHVVQLTADLVGPPNPITAPTLHEAVSALGLHPANMPLPALGRRGLAGISSLGNTEPAALAVAALLEEAGFTPVVFHASGPGGERLEQLAATGQLSHIVEVAPHELVAEVLGEDLYRCRQPRLWPHPGVSRIFLPGSLDYYCLGPEKSIPAQLLDRPRVMHNPLNANVMTSSEERVRLAMVAGERLGRADAAAVVPMHGWSQAGAEGMPLFDLASVREFAEELGRRLPTRRLEAHINAPAVTQAVGELIGALWTQRSASIV